MSFDNAQLLKIVSMWLVSLLVTLFLSSCGGGGGGEDGSSLPQPNTPTNSSPSGALTINGVLLSGETLTLSNDIADANGLGTFSYQWHRTINNATSDISNATTINYLIESSDIGYTLSASVSYIDGDNFSETIVSSETGAVTASQTTGKTNILLIISDDQGLDASAQYNYSSDVPVTPTINQLANGGITFDNVWATPACTTTRGTIITGQHGVKSGIDFIPASMDSSTQTLQRFLKSQSNSSDYNSAVIGKWHLGGGNSALDHPLDSGIEYYAGSIQGTIDDYYDWDLTINGVSSNSTEYHTTKLTDLAIDWLAEQRVQNTPWFLWLAYVAPHSPFHLPPANLHSRSELSGTQADIDVNKREYYLAAIEAMDTEIGRLLAAIPDDELANTLIIYIGDNGTPSAVIDASVYNRQHGKGSLYEGGIRVPMVASGAGVTRENVHESALVNTSDFFATINQVAGNSISHINNSYSFSDLLSESAEGKRNYNYSEFISADVSGWVVRNDEYKLIEFSDGSQELYQVSIDLAETNNLLLTASHTDIVNELSAEAERIRNSSAIDITNIQLTNRSANCAAYVENYQSTVSDIKNSREFNGNSTIIFENGKCIIHTDNIPNHDFNDGEQAFPNDVSEQDIVFEITASPIPVANPTAISLNVDNAILLNGVKVDLLAAACFGVGDGKIGCNDINQPWRYDPMYLDNGFQVDSHNAHSQPNGSYHYHGKPNALFSDVNTNEVSPLVGFAADGFPIFGSYFESIGSIRKALSSFQLKAGSRPSGAGEPGGAYDGTYRDDYEFVDGSGDLDQCNGMTIDGVYGYYVTDGFPYVLSCFTGVPDASFIK
ncbi:MAG: arylsulfatase A-like enzyme [Enterobacterales bacterium]|jgi:arylsulfatase A-like enzyme